jgi:hypothetical protein
VREITLKTNFNKEILRERRGALRFSTFPQRKNGTTPAPTSVAVAFISTTGDKEKRQEACIGRGQKFVVAIPALCMCNPLGKIHENHSHFYHMEQHTDREIPVLLKPETMPLTRRNNMI